jgi:hypothetical protein
MTERLTTLAAVKDWLDITTDDSDAADSFDRCSLSVCPQPGLTVIASKSAATPKISEAMGRQLMLLLNWPIVQSSDLWASEVAFVSASTIGNAGLPGSGYTISDDPQCSAEVDLYGRVLVRCSFTDHLYSGLPYNTIPTSYRMQPHSSMLHSRVVNGVLT